MRMRKGTKVCVRVLGTSESSGVHEGGQPWGSGLTRVPCKCVPYCREEDPHLGPCVSVGTEQRSDQVCVGVCAHVCAGRHPSVPGCVGAAG